MKYLKIYEEFNNNFKSWFGNSKVVDSNGRPLKVYHQTNEIFDVFDINKSYTHSFWFTSNLGKIKNGETGANNHPDKKVHIMEVYLSIQNMAGWDEYEKYGVGELLQMGYDGVKLDDDYIVFSPSQIKSVNNNGNFDVNNDNIYERYKRLYESSEPVTPSNFYRLFNTLVYIDDIDMFDAEWRVSMIKANGKERIYIGSKNDIINDFKYTTDSFNIKIIKNNKPVVSSKDSTKTKATYNIVYYVGNKKVETLKTNLERKFAYALKHTFSKNPIYKMGQIKLEINN